MRRLVPLAALLLTLAAVVVAVRWRSVGALEGAVNANCFGDLNRQTYTSGFQTTDFQSTTAVDINAAGSTNAGLQLDTNLTPLNPEKIVLPFDQDVRVKSVYNNAGATHTFGWFYLDQISPTYYNATTNTLVDANNNGVPDWYEALYIKSGSTPMLLSSSKSYSDGGNWPHIPNLLEPYDPVNNPTGVGHLVFKILNDNSATGWTFSYNGVNLPPIQDTSSTVDGIFDYDVNGDGVLSEADRTQDLGIIQGNREVVFYLVVYYGQTGKQSTYGETGTSTANSGINVHFSKTVLNTDIGGVNAGDTISYIDIGAPGVKSTGNTCEQATPATTSTGVPTPLVGSSFVNCGGTPYPSWVNNDATKQSLVFGWLSQPAIDRLNTATYNFLQLPHEVHRVVAGASGTAPHYFVGAPTTDQNRWIIGFEDLLGYTASKCGSCTQSDFSLEDVVMLIERTNGGEVVSQNVASDIPAGSLATTIISKVRLRYAATYPSPGCDNSPDATINFYYSVDNKKWRQVSFPDRTQGDVTVDVLKNGDVGNQLYWKADIVSTSQDCQPVLSTVNVGYEAVQHGEFKYAAPIPLSNMIYSGTVETPSSSWTVTNNDYSLRGHFYATQLFDPKTLQDTTATQWDAGKVLQAQSPDTRIIYTNNGSGGSLPFNVINGSALYSSILTSGARTAQLNGNYVYDFNGDTVVDDTDAQFVMQWTRGWEVPPNITITPTPTTQPLMRAWKLGAVHNSSPALVGPPGHPSWLDGSAAPKTLISAFNTFQSTNAKRKTLAVVGAQDGMMHAFNAGSFRWGADPDCNLATSLVRGCFAQVNGVTDYGDGSEVWAWVPPTQLSQLKNNLPAVGNYLPAQNPEAEVDGSVSVEDMYLHGGFVTAIFASLGREQPYVTAVYIGTDPTKPTPLWASDWSDPNFNGSELSPAVALAQVPPGMQWIAVIGSGVASIVDDVYLFLIDPSTGQLLQQGSTVIGKVKLNANGAPGTYGVAGYPNLVDANGDGVVDRVYAVDTSGRVWKLDLTTMQSCQIATAGESVFSGMAISQVTTNPPRVRLFLGGAPNPDGTANPPLTPPYHLFAFEDDDTVGSCSANKATLVYTQALDASSKVWAAPFADGTNVFWATSSGSSESVCATGGGSFFGIQQSTQGSSYALLPGTASLSGSAVSSIRIFDGHAFVNTIGGTTTQIGGSGWNNQSAGFNSSKVLNLNTVLWQEL